MAKGASKSVSSNTIAFHLLPTHHYTKEGFAAKQQTPLFSIM